MSSLLQRSSTRGLIAAIFAVGIVRFILSVAGLPNSTVKLFSMSVIIALGAVYFAITTGGHMERLYATYCLTVPYLIVEVLALAYTWLTGQQTIFQADEYRLGFGIGQHMLAHLVGGLTFEPLFLFIFIEIIWAIYTVVRRLVG